MAPSLVLVTEPEFRRGENVFTAVTGVRCVAAPSAEDELAHVVTQHGARHVIVGSVPYREQLYGAMPRGGVIARFGVGHENIDKARATKSGVLCTNTPEVLDQSVAEHAMLLVAAAARQLAALTADMSDGVWKLRPGVELRGKTLAIVGYGGIGRAVARIASRGFGMRVIGCRRSAARAGTTDEEPDVEAMTSDFAEAVRDADYVSLHMPALPENARFINRERLGLLRKDAWLVNTARGAVLDETALFDALKAGRLGGAALDVYEREPYDPIDPSRDLRTLANVILTPHVGSNTADANRGMAERAVRNVLAAEAGDFAGMDLLNPEVTQPATEA